MKYKISLFIFALILLTSFVAAQAVTINYPANATSTINASVVFNATANALLFGNQSHGIALGTGGNVGPTETTGMRVTSNVTGYIYNVTVYTGVTGNIVRVTNDANAEIANATIVSRVATFSSPVPIVSGTNYRVVVGTTSGGTWNHQCNSGASLPHVTTAFSWINGIFNGNADNTYFCNIQDIGYYSSNFAGVMQNATFLMYHQNGTLFNRTVNTLSARNSTAFNITNFQLSNYLWDISFCSSNSSTTTCLSAKNYTFSWGLITNLNSFNATSYETASESFITNISLGNGLSVSSANIIYNGTSYSGAVTTSGSNSLLTSSLTLPTGTGSKMWYWNLIFSNGQIFNLSQNTQTVDRTELGICNASNTQKYLNLTFKDESTLSNIAANITSSTFYYWLGDGTVNKSLSYSNLVGNQSYLFCLTPPHATANVNVDLQYEASNYPQRPYSPGTLSLTNSTLSKILYLLASADGTYVTFQVINAAEQPLAGVNVNITRVINGANTILGQGTTGSDGGITFWLNPDFSHTANFLLSPYPFYSVTQAFTQSSYTITLGSGGSSNATDYTKGITTSVKPATYYLSNGTTYNFNLTLTSTYWALDSFGFNITNQNGTLVGSAISTSSGGGVVSLNLNTVNNETLYMTYFWQINGTNTTGARSWLIIDLGGNSFSIARWVADFKTYVGLGFFGITDFGVGIICFIVILSITGIVKVKNGLTDEAVVVGIIFALVALLDVGLTIIPNPVGAIDHFPTVVMGLIFLGFMFKEVFQ